MTVDFTQLEPEELARASACAMYDGTVAHPNRWRAAIVVNDPVKRVTLWTGSETHRSIEPAQQEAEQQLMEMFA